MRIYLDMDGVIADFMGHAVTVLGRDYRDEYWNGKSKERAKMIEDTGTFWHHIPLLPDALELIEHLKPHDLHIMSAYAKWDKNSQEGKKYWLSNHMSFLPEKNVNLVLRHQKQFYATHKYNGTPNVLIDDYEKNVKEWIARGGIGIVHTSARETIEQIKGLGII